MEVIDHALIASIPDWPLVVTPDETLPVRRTHPARVGGAFLGMKDFVEASSQKHPMALEETLYNLVLEALKAHPVVILDDLHLIDLYSSG